MTAREVAVILDPSAILEYTRENVAIGELLGDIAEEGRVVGIPVIALAEAYVAADEDAYPWLDLLARLNAVEVIDVDHDRLGRIGARGREVGLGVSQAVDLVLHHRAWLYTSRRDEVSKVIDDVFIIDC